jgi:hypothetical protein
MTEVTTMTGKLMTAARRKEALEQFALTTTLRLVTPDEVVAELWQHIAGLTDLLHRIHANGCPTYRCNDGSRTRDGCNLCTFCEANIDTGEQHAADCVWLEVVAVDQ